MLPSLDDYLQAKTLRYYFTLSRNIDDQWILQFDWTRGKTGHNQPLVVSSFDTFQRYWLSKNPVIWMDKRYYWPHPTKSSSLRSYLPLLHPCKKIESIDWLLPKILMIKEYRNLIGWEHFKQIQNHKEHCYAPFLGYKKTHQWIKFFAKPKKPYFGEFFGLFPKMTHFPKQKMGLSVFDFYDPLTSRKISKIIQNNLRIILWAVFEKH